MARRVKTNFPDWPVIDNCCDICDNFKDDGIGFPVTHQPRCLYRCDDNNTVIALVDNIWNVWCTKYQGQTIIGGLANGKST